MSDSSRPSWAMGGITNESVEKYLYSLLPARDEVLAEIEAQAAKRKIPIVGPLVGRLFHLIASISGARKVFEMGSAVGYSSIWWARAVGPQGRVIYTDGDRKNADEARGYFARAGVADRIEIHTGDALEILSERAKEEFDIVFCDIDKGDYPRALKMAVPRVRKGGLFVADNTLWHGDVARPPAEHDERTKAIVEFNRMMYESKELEPVTLPLRDGVSVARKI
ncbi:MAG: O-methyltransferase [Terriglobales bacterium]